MARAGCAADVLKANVRAPHAEGRSPALSYGSRIRNTNGAEAGRDARDFSFAWRARV